MERIIDLFSRIVSGLDAFVERKSNDVVEFARLNKQRIEIIEQLTKIEEDNVKDFKLHKYNDIVFMKTVPVVVYGILSNNITLYSVSHENMFKKLIIKHFPNHKNYASEYNMITHQSIEFGFFLIFGFLEGESRQCFIHIPFNTTFLTDLHSQIYFIGCLMRYSREIFMNPEACVLLKNMTLLREFKFEKVTISLDDENKTVNSVTDEAYDIANMLFVNTRELMFISEIKHTFALKDPDFEHLICFCNKFINNHMLSTKSKYVNICIDCDITRLRYSDPRAVFIYQERLCAYREGLFTKICFCVYKIDGSKKTFVFKSTNDNLIMIVWAQKKADILNIDIINTLSIKKTDLNLRFFYEEILKLPVESLDVSNIFCDDFSTFFLQKATTLKYLTITGCKVNMSALEKQLKKFVNLKALNLSNSVFKRVSVHTFASLKNLQLLNLKNCKIIAVESEAFLSLGNLKFLNLEGNEIFGEVYYKSSRIFKPLSNLRVINVKNCGFDDRKICRFLLKNFRALQSFVY